MKSQPQENSNHSLTLVALVKLPLLPNPDSHGGVVPQKNAKNTKSDCASATRLWSAAARRPPSWPVEHGLQKRSQATALQGQAVPDTEHRTPNTKYKEPAMKTRHTHFTLIELLTVIAIIAILAGMLFPAVKAVQTAAKKNKAKAQMHAIITAIKSYESTYGVLPYQRPAASAGEDTIWGKDLCLTDGTAANNGAPRQLTGNPDAGAYDTLMCILTQQDTTATTAASGNLGSTAGNIRKIKFLDAPPDFSQNSLLDPWGQRYVIMLDTNYDGKLDNFTNSLISIPIGNSIKEHTYSPTNTTYSYNFTYAGGDNIKYGSVQLYSVGVTKTIGSYFREHKLLGSWE